MRPKLKNIKDAYEYEEICDDMMCDFVDTFRYGKEKYKNPQYPKYGFMLTNKGNDLINDYIRRLTELGEKTFTDHPFAINIKCSAVNFV